MKALRASELSAALHQTTQCHILGDLKLYDWFHLRLLALRTCKSSVVIPEKKTSFGNDLFFQSSDEKVGGGGGQTTAGVGLTVTGQSQSSVQ
jgi:hypothetical protein